ncbi:MAG: quinolinate synthase NadA [Elusimicrobia bacterium]|nr:quinolinate synthase NadA [Elusimicrobiota bacterium]
MSFSDKQIQAQIQKLISLGLGNVCLAADLSRVAQLSLKINFLKKEQNAVVAGHFYQHAEILLSVADFTGDSYFLSKKCAETTAQKIIFCGVRFMAETAKIMSPQKTVILPSPDAGCSLSESIAAQDVRALKKKYPACPVVTYINTSAEVKAESDCVVTSANAEKILSQMYKRHRRIIFIPDVLMGKNLAASLGKKIGSEIVLWHGTCIVHENFDPAIIPQYRKLYPGIAVLAHSECPPEIARSADFLGGTGGMLKYIEETKAPAYLLITECGLGELAKIRFPEKNFIAMCRMCPYMKITRLEQVLSALENPSPAQIINVPPAISRKAAKSIENMFKLAEKPL